MKKYHGMFLICVIYWHGTCASVTWLPCMSWWRHQMVTFSALLAICAGNSPVPGEFPTQRPVTRSFDVFFDLRLNKQLSKQSWGWWLETLSRPMWRHRNVMSSTHIPITTNVSEYVVCRETVDNFRGAIEYPLQNFFSDNELEVHSLIISYTWFV